MKTPKNEKLNGVIHLRIKDEGITPSISYYIILAFLDTSILLCI
jgi:hypothetical protein